MIVFSVNFPIKCTSFISEHNCVRPCSVLHGSEIYSSCTELYRIRIHTDVRTFSFLIEFFLFSLFLIVMQLLCGWRVVWVGVSDCFA